MGTKNLITKLKNQVETKKVNVHSNIDEEKIVWQG